MIEVSLLSVGLVAPGLSSWRQSTAMLREEAAYQPEPLPPLKPAILKPSERRRTTDTIKLALAAAGDALDQAPWQKRLLSVFACSEGDLNIVHQICHALTQDGRPVSPTQFHNSVHNAAAGYGSIATGHQQASTSISGQQGTFAAGLLEAAVQTISEEMPVLLVVYDHPAPFPLNEIVNIGEPFAVSLLLSSRNDSSAHIAELAVKTTHDDSVEVMPEARMEAMRLANPAGRALPLLQALARKKQTCVKLPYLPNLGLMVDILPC